MSSTWRWLIVAVVIRIALSIPGIRGLSNTFGLLQINRARHVNIFSNIFSSILVVSKITTLTHLLSIILCSLLKFLVYFQFAPWCFSLSSLCFANSLFISTYRTYGSEVAKLRKAMDAIKIRSVAELLKVGVIWMIGNYYHL